MTTTYRLDVKKNDAGELYVEFPDDLMNSVGWHVGDTLVWDDRKDGSWSLSKKDKKKTAKLLQKPEGDDS
jgi:hypothetical protein